MPSETGKSDMERIGLFSEMEYISIGDKYVSPFNRPFNDAASKNKQMLPGGNKEKAATQAGYFDPVYARIFEGESYLNPVQLRRRYRMAESKKNLSKPFLPSNGEKFPCGIGTYYGTIGGPCAYFSAQAKDKMPYVAPGKNLYTNPGKKGTGYGYANLTIGKPYPHSVELYDQGRINFKKMSEEHHRLMKGGAFKLNLYPREYFDVNPYHDDKPLPPPKKQPPPAPVTQPFKPTSPAKKASLKNKACQYFHDLAKYKAYPENKTYQYQVVVGAGLCKIWYRKKRKMPPRNRMPLPRGAPSEWEPARAAAGASVRSPAKVEPQRRLSRSRGGQRRKDRDPAKQPAGAGNNPPDKMSGKRRSSSVDYKKRIVEDSKGKNLAAFCLEKKIDMRLVQKWRADYDKLSLQVLMGNSKKRKCGSGRQPLLPELEDMISEWIADRRAKALVVRRADIRAFALEMAPQFEISPEFKASHRWLDGFLQRYDMSLRKSTTLFKLEDAEVVKRALAFKSFVDGIDFSKYQPCNVIAMDETAVFMGQGAQTTIEQRGASSIYVPSTGHESTRVTCVLAIRLDGQKVTPVIISKGKKNKIERVSGIYVLESEKAWCTQAVIRRWLELMLPLVTRGGQRGLLVWDSASTHRAKDMKKFLAQRRIDQIMIPAGMTAYLQTLDIAINKPFKDNLRVEINDYIENRMTRNQRGNFVKPGLQEVVNWVRKSWDKISDSVVAKALRAGYLDKSCSFTESCIARHERLGPMVLKELESQDIQDGIPDMESYDDIPEEDDFIILE